MPAESYEILPLFAIIKPIQLNNKSMKGTLLVRVVATLLFTFAIVTAGFSQGVTTSAMNGQVTDASGDALPGATIVATHTPSGSTYGNVTDVKGFFRIPNMRVGGPYKITVSFVGFESYEREDVFLTLGQTYALNVELSDNVTQLAEVVVVANQNDIFDGNRTGQETVIGEEAINAAPTVSRSIADYVRLNPLANIQENNDGFTMSIAGQNNRFNAIYIDGAVNNDVFGLSGSGTNGGQTGVQPISVDAIEQFQVAVAPFDVRQSGFAGGSINAVTRSGTNDFEGLPIISGEMKTLPEKIREIWLEIMNGKSSLLLLHERTDCVLADLLSKTNSSSL